MTTFTTTATPCLTEMQLDNLDAGLYIVQPAYVHIFHSLRILDIQLPKRMEGPVDILPHLHRLKDFTAKNLFLPIYPPAIHLPFPQTLSDLFLKSVSIQWMAGQFFPALECCYIVFPPHVNTTALQPVSMPSCTEFEYIFNDLGPWRYFHHCILHNLHLECGLWNVWRGNSQLVSLSSTFIDNTQSLTKLRVHVQCSESLLTEMLKLVPALEQFGLGVTSPYALSEKFFQQFVATEPSASSSHGMIGL
jgi:hypothetical protein